jgi:hypothetical protein
MISAQPGLIPQMAGSLTNLRIWDATIFVDNFSNYVYLAFFGMAHCKPWHSKGAKGLIRK